MQVITIPFGYEELPASERNRVVPICIPAFDKHGERIAWGWFEAVDKVQDPLRKLSRVELQDEWRVSEVAEGAVHGVWSTHGENLGRSPAGQVYARAKWYARDLRAGGKSQRNGLTVGLDEIDYLVRMKLETDPTDHAARYCRELDLATISEELAASGSEDVSAILDCMQDGLSWIEMGRRMGKKPDTLRKRFDRWLERKSDIAQRLLEILR